MEINGFLKLDWLAFTYKAPMTLIDSIRLDDTFNGPQSKQLACFRAVFPELEPVWEYMTVFGSRHHYTSSLKAGSDFLCCYNDDDNINGIGKNMGVNFEIPSHSLSMFFELLHIDIDDKYAVTKMMNLLKDRGCKCSRIDLAFDDPTKTFRPIDYANWWNNGCFRSHTQTSTYVSSGSGKRAGNTFYLGSLKRRDRILRIYDKDVQTDGKIDCVRYEFELHSKYAAELQEFLCRSRLQIGTYIRTWFEIIDCNDNTTNKSMCPLNREWEEFVTKSVFCEQLSDITVPVYSVRERMMSTSEYVRNYLLPTLKGYCMMYGVEKLFAQIQASPPSQRYVSEFDSFKLRSSSGIHTDIKKSDFKHLQGMHHVYGMTPFDDN